MLKWNYIKNIKPNNNTLYFTYNYIDGDLRLCVYRENINKFTCVAYCSKCKCENCTDHNNKIIKPDLCIELIISDLPKKELWRSIDPLKRLKILKRDSYKCKNCGDSPSINENTELEIDHIIPYSLGGSHEIENLQVLCKRCNREKGNKT